MAPYIPAIIWLIGLIIFSYIAKKRHVKQTFIRTFLAVLLGPFAIPFILFFKPDKAREVRVNYTDPVHGVETINKRQMKPRD